MEDELARRLEIVSAAMSQTVQEARELRSATRQTLALQKEVLWQMNQEREKVRNHVRQAHSHLMGPDKRDLQ